MSPVVSLGSGEVEEGDSGTLSRSAESAGWTQLKSIHLWREEAPGWGLVTLNDIYDLGYI